jgi:signal transduction histidine kinase
VLKPVADLTATARSISSQERTGRIEVRGSAEAAEMARTFNGMLERLEAAHAAQAEFLVAAGHELRAPLTVVAGHLEVLADDEDPRATIELVLEEVHRMGAIVARIGSLTSGEDEPLLLTTVDLEPFTRQVFTKVRVLADRRWTLDQAGDGIVLADPDRITEAVLNLAENAVAHTVPGDVIGIGSRVANGWVELWVRDDGEGIDPADQQRIFEPFVRGRAAQSRYRGAGLGLALTQRHRRGARRTDRGPQRTRRRCPLQVDPPRSG